MESFGFPFLNAAEIGKINFSIRYLWFSFLFIFSFLVDGVFEASLQNLTSSEIIFQI